MSEPLELAEVRAVVTGAGRGLGRGIALGLARRGASLSVLDIDATSAEAVARELQAERTIAIAVGVDVTDEVSVREAVGVSLERFGGIDLLVNNAGVLAVSPVVEMTLEDWRRVMDVNITGVFLMSREVARAMVAAGGGGSIVSIASIAGKRGDPTLAHYSASKFAVVGFTQSLARELAARGITVNAVCPGVVETPMIEALAEGWHTSAEEMLAPQAIRRPQTPDEIASAIAFLHQNRSITGQAINVDGGTVFN